MGKRRIKKKVHKAADPPRRLLNIVVVKIVPKFGLRLLNFGSFVTVKPSQTSYSCVRQRRFAFKCGDSRLHATEESNSISDAYVSGKSF